MFPVLQEVPGPEAKELHEDMFFDPGWVNSSFIAKCLNVLDRLLSGSSEAPNLYFRDQACLAFQLRGRGTECLPAYLHIAHGFGGSEWTLGLEFECLARLAPVLCLSTQSDELPNHGGELAWIYYSLK